MTKKRCLLDGLTKDACSPQSSAHIAFHGASGRGGRVGAAGLPEDYRLITLENAPARESQPKVYDMFDKYAETFSRQFGEDPTQIKSLYLHSPNPGNGKSTSAAAILNAYLLTHFIGSIQRGLTPKQRPALFLDVSDWHADYNQFNRSKVPDSIAEPAAKRYYTMMERAKHVDFLVCDDIGTRDYTENFTNDLHTVINYRVTNRLPSVYTSNLPIKYEGTKDPRVTQDLVDLFGEERLADRIGDMCMKVPFAGESKRGRR
ncbi:DNA replication protein [Thalassobacillus sp. CUG 92003]|uniref:DNA replication protein n=1 Tax=Thalassobacillus sp. CUG 92003 TaxID=2736641 RepID=UPI0015E7AC72|nr:DNA replication protein [Thalassobacillus sp. CUG 92003]